MRRERTGTKVIWSVTGIILSILIIYFVGSLTWLFSNNIIILFKYLAILIATISILILI